MKIKLSAKDREQFRKAGRIGGKTTRRKLTAAQRKAISKKANAARWGKKEKGKT